ncbi:hypothetical protein JAAARDRAFT_42352 [Jaapia argillacea MUCL 33604]|uniref:Enoyl reductase (ER) domain-containing protein n=1 Tax=Jaapia argillacea MUCL 33604 TaxID=933084 RepID=A0A067PHZ2_9AGAM|nr:hypothetical protein JAAARDRAFT_42352 [Jaapia argillacea MUCL 33604]
MAAIHQVPQTTKSLLVKASLTSKALTTKKPASYDAVLTERPIPSLKQGEILVKIGAAGFNHRDLWIRLGQYPSIGEGNPYGADGAGTVVASAQKDDPLISKRVFLLPMRGWKSHPDAPESNFVIVGGVSGTRVGTFSEYVVVERDQVILTPHHLDDIHAAAWPLGGVTAWRAVNNARVKKGDNILITGIGGGVALIALQLSVAKGANVYVTSSSAEKIQKAVEMGAKAGFDYKDANWSSDLVKTLKTDSKGHPELDAIIDSGGGDILASSSKALKPGARVVVYGMTAKPQIPFTMREVLKHIQLIGSTMGSHKDLEEATAFIAQHRIIPTVSRVIDGLENAEEGFGILKSGSHFGKVVIEVGGSGSGVKAKL